MRVAEQGEVIDLEKTGLGRRCQPLARRQGRGPDLEGQDTGSSHQCARTALLEIDTPGPGAETAENRRECRAADFQPMGQAHEESR